jgi:Methenyl tetrahydrofolate cyclohydrolase
MLSELTVKDFLKVTAGSDPVPGGGSVSALCASISSALGEMVANLTIGRKKYIEVEEEMKEVAAFFAEYQKGFTQAIEDDSDAYNVVFDAFKLPKETDEEKAIRSEKIQIATKHAAEIPLSVARKAYEIMDKITYVAQNGNQNAVTDACVSMMCARTAVLGALLNVRINLSSLKDTEYVEKVTAEADNLEKMAISKENALLQWVKTVL